MRKFSNDETINTLLNWTEAQKATERLASAILGLSGFTDINPSHPIGGRDGGKDLTCRKDQLEYIVAVSFNNGAQKFNLIKNKFQSDLKKMLSHNPDGVIFMTNQRLTLSERDILNLLVSENKKCEIFDLERIAAILSAPSGYGVRLEYLSIEMSKDEQLSYFSLKDNEILKFSGTLRDLIDTLARVQGLPDVSPEKLMEFKNILELITGDKNTLYGYGSGMIDRLKVPLTELREFGQELNQLFLGHGYSFSAPHSLDRLNVPLDELRQFREEFNYFFGSPYDERSGQNMLKKLNIPLSELGEFRVELEGLFARYNLHFQPLSGILSVPIDDLKAYQQALVHLLSLRTSSAFGFTDPLLPPIAEIKSYNKELDEALVKLQQIKQLQGIVGFQEIPKKN